MTWLALILGVAALVLALTARLEQARQHKQIERLRSMLHRLQQPPAQPPAQPPKHAPEHAPAHHLPPHATHPPAASPIDQATLADGPSQPCPTAKRSEPAPDQTRSITGRPPIVTGRASGAAAPPARVEVVKPAARPTVSLEERLGAGVYVWIGGIALMLAGAFLVKYSFDNELLSVRIRLALAGGFGAVLVLASLWVRSRADKVAAAICGAGVAVLFAAVLAATAHYHELDPWWGFALMVVITATAVGMSLLHGPFVALLGLIGGFITPTLLASADQDAWGPTFTYLLLLEIGLAAVTRRRQWFGLSALTLLASVVSAVAYTLFAWDADSRGWLILFVLGTAVVFVINAARSAERDADRPKLLQQVWLGVGAVGSSALLMTMLIAFSAFSMVELASLGCLRPGRWCWRGWTALCLASVSQRGAVWHDAAGLADRGGYFRSC